MNTQSLVTQFLAELKSAVLEAVTLEVEQLFAAPPRETLRLRGRDVSFSLRYPDGHVVRSLKRSARSASIDAALATASAICETPGCTKARLKTGKPGRPFTHCAKHSKARRRRR